MAAMPRSFKLLDELDDEKKGKNPPGISVGLTSEDDETLSEFNGSIIVMRGGGGLIGRFLTLRIFPGADYPRSVPRIQFVSRVNLPCVAASGEVDRSKVPYLAAWNAGCTIAGALAAIQTICESAGGAQPAEGLTY